jgi:hypothetical protein
MTAPASCGSRWIAAATVKPSHPGIRTSSMAKPNGAPCRLASRNTASA